MWTLLRVFLSTPSARRATADCNVDVVLIAGFLSTPSARRATPPIAAIDHIAEFLSTPSARRATSCPATPSTEQRNFYPRPPRGGRRTAIPDKPVRRDFYPRPPRGGRRGCAHGLPLRKNFYPRPPRGGRPRSLAKPSRSSYFYPRPPRGGRPTRKRPASSTLYFYPRPPRGGRHKVAPHVFLAVHISIHALREEGDAESRRTDKAIQHFYPRPPRGGRPWRPLLHHAARQFLSTPSARRATLLDRLTRPLHCYFYPRPPRGGRRPLLFGRGDTTLISIHALREEGDIRCSWSSSVSRLFLSTPSARRATPKSRSRSLTTFYFYPRPPRGGRRCQSLQTT